MAKSITLRNVGQATIPAEAAAKYVTFWDQPGGIDTLSSLARMDREHARDMTNLRWHGGKLKSRLGTAIAFTGTGGMSGTMLDFVPFLAKDDTVNFVIFRGHASVLDNEIFQWHDVTNTVPTVPGPTPLPVLVADRNSRLSFVSWDGNLVVSDGASGIWTINVAAHNATRIWNALSAQQLFVFDSRLLACGLPSLPSRVQWSVKNDNTDISGLGSGFDDLLSTPGGIVGAVVGGYPITDELALILRTDGVWQVSVTGDFRSPFRFSRLPLAVQVSVAARRTVAQIPGGIIVVGQDDIYEISVAGVDPIGGRVRDQIFSSLRGLVRWNGEYNRFTQTYRLSCISTVSGSTCDTVWEYSRITKEWYKYEYPYDIYAMAFLKYDKATLTIDTLNALGATINALDAPTIDDMGVTAYAHGTYMLVDGATIVREDDAVTDDNGTDGALAITTGLVFAGSSLNKQRAVQLILEYQSTEAQTIKFYYSDDGGNTWNYLDTVATVASAFVQQMAIQKPIERYNLQFKISSSTLGQLTIISFNARVVEMGPVQS